MRLNIIIIDTSCVYRSLKACRIIKLSVLAHKIPHHYCLLVIKIIYNSSVLADYKTKHETYNQRSMNNILIKMFVNIF